MRIIPANQRHYADHGWLKTYWLFSFADYYDPDNTQFGPLRVFNDDIVEANTGFPTHPHREMEIVTIVLSGEVTHEDSMGNKNVIKAGDVQRMSAGTGITHSEYNRTENPVHFYQIWIFPDKKGLDPSYQQKSFSEKDWHNRIYPVASGQGIAHAVDFHTDATICRCALDADKKVKYVPAGNRCFFMYMTKGVITINGEELAKEEQARIETREELEIEATLSAEFILIDLPSTRGLGYDTKTLKGMKLGRDN